MERLPTGHSGLVDGEHRSGVPTATSNPAQNASLSRFRLPGTVFGDDWEPRGERSQFRGGKGITGPGRACSKPVRPCLP